jgi:putative DNA primase/helicase
LVLCADDDLHTTGNPGMTKAREAASVVGGIVAAPSFGQGWPEGATDFNDLHQLRGAPAVAETIAEAITTDTQRRAQMGRAA